MGWVQVVMSAGLPYTALRGAILTHPTLIEGLNFCLRPYLPRQLSRSNGPINDNSQIVQRGNWRSD